MNGQNDTQKGADVIIFTLQTMEFGYGEPNIPIVGTSERAL